MNECREGCRRREAAIRAVIRPRGDIAGAGDRRKGDVSRRDNPPGCRAASLTPGPRRGSPAREGPVSRWRAGMTADSTAPPDDEGVWLAVYDAALAAGLTPQRRRCGRRGRATAARRQRAGFHSRPRAVMLSRLARAAQGVPACSLAILSKALLALLARRLPVLSPVSSVVEASF